MTLDASLLVGDIRPVYKKYDIEYLMFRIGNLTPEYICVEKCFFIKRFTPIRVSYSIDVHPPFSQSFEEFELHEKTMYLNNLADMIVFLSSICKLFLIQFYLSRYYNGSEVARATYRGTDAFCISDQINISSMSIFNGENLLISPKRNLNNMGDIVAFFADALSIDDTALFANISVASQFVSKYKSIRIQTKKNQWKLIPDKAIEKDVYPKNDLIGVGGMFSLGLTFLRGYEESLFRSLNFKTGLLESCLYERTSDPDDPELDHRLCIDDIVSNPDMFFLNTCTRNQLILWEDIVSALSSLRDIGMIYDIISRSKYSEMVNPEFLIEISFRSDDMDITDKIVYNFINEDLETDEDQISKFINYTMEELSIR